MLLFTTPSHLQTAEMAVTFCRWKHSFELNKSTWWLKRVWLDPNHFGFQRAGAAKEEEARANLNGGELDQELFFGGKRGQPTMTWVLYSTGPVLLLCTTKYYLPKKYYSSTTLHYKVLAQYYPVLQSTTTRLGLTTVVTTNKNCDKHNVKSLESQANLFFFPVTCYLSLLL